MTHKRKKTVQKPITFEKRIGSASIANLPRLYELPFHCDRKSMRLSNPERSRVIIREAKELERSTMLQGIKGSKKIDITV